MDSYQPIYDAVRSRISGGNIADAVERVARQAFDFGPLVPRAIELVGIVENALTRPSAVFRPSLFADGTQWCALYGDDLASGIAGFGDTPEAAMTAFDIAWLKEKTPAAQRALSDKDQ